MPYSYIWEYRVHPDKVQEFEQLYGPEGGWAELFRQYKGYRQTLLLKDQDTPLRYLTIDIWDSKAAFEAFRAESRDAFSKLDEKGEQCTIVEKSLGDFEISD